MPYMYKIRKLQIPGMQKSAGEFDEPLLHSRYSEIHKVTVKWIQIVLELFLMSQKKLSLIKSSSTFYVVPKILYQLFTIFCFYRGHTIPVIHQQTRRAL